MSRQDEIEQQREMIVAKRNDMLQKARFNLTVQEQKAILFAISHIKPEDTYLQEYEFDIKDFYSICGIEKDTYTVLKKMLKGLRDKSWWIQEQDESGKVWDSSVSWFDVVRVSQKSGKVRVGFHRDMMPYLIELSKQYALNDQNYTQYKLKYVLAMQSKFSPRLYEILKSYDNNTTWFFQVEELHKLLSDSDKDGNPLIPKSWTNFAEFRRRVLEPAVSEINKYTDMRIAYKEERSGRGGKVAKIHSLLLSKTNGQLIEADKAIRDELDGQMNLFEVDKDMKDHPDPFNLAKQEQLAVIRAERAAEAEAEIKAEQQKKKAKQKISEWLDPK